MQITASTTAPTPTTTPTLDRPPVPAELRRGFADGTRVSARLGAVVEALTSGLDRTGGRPVPGREALEQAVAAVEALAPELARFGTEAAAVLGPKGSRRDFVLPVSSSVDQAQQHGVNDHDLRTLATIARATDALREVIGTGSSAKFDAAFQQLQGARIGADALAHQILGTHEGQFHSTAASFAADTLAQFDQDGNGVIDVVRERLSTLDRGGKATYGVVSDGSARLTAADAAGDHNGVVDATELARLFAPFDADGDAWLSAKDEDAVQARFPVVADR